ncbi:MAG: hypothetical protein AVDCRST_MAG66-3773, partial [uncultured Pseudonocardia sp.]
MAIYQSEEDLRSRVLPFIYEGLAGGDAVQVIASSG